MKWYFTLALALALVAGSLRAEEPKKERDEPTFGALKTPTTAEVKAKAEAWLKSTGKANDAQFKAIWDADTTLIEKIANTLSLGDAQAAKLLQDARDPSAPAPIELPALLKDKSKPTFFRQGLILAYGKALTLRKVYEEALEVFGLLKPEEAIDPAAYFFYKAVCEHALILKDKADASIDRLLVDVSDSPERYRMVAALMHFDMLTWQEKDLGWIARKMDNIQRRLELKRGGKQTQKIQKEVLVRLEEMIKKLENDSKPPPPGGGGGGGEDVPSGGGGMPGGGSAPGSDTSSGPMRDTMGGTANGTGQIDPKKAREIAEAWGKLPEKERAAALRDLTRTMPAKDRAVIEAYFRELQKKSGSK